MALLYQILEVCIEALVEEAVRGLLAPNVSLDDVPPYPLTGQQVQEIPGVQLAASHGCKDPMQHRQQPFE